MKKYISLLVVLLAMSCVYAQEVTPVQILTVDQMPKAEKFLPAPPSLTDPLFFNDMVQYQRGKSLRETERGKQAVADAQLTVDYFMQRFGAAMGRELTSTAYPNLATYMLSTYTTVRMSIQTAKDYFKRVRPYAQFKETSGVPEAELPNDLTSYPSGHTVRAWALALALVSIDPEHQNEILQVGYELGQSRVIVGFHYQSDVEAARLAGSAAFARICTEPVFLELFKKAKAEFISKTK